MLLTTLNDMAIKEKVKELSRELKIELSKLHQQRVNLIASAVISMSTIRSVNMVKVAHGMISKAKPLSNYRRLQRFISQVDWDDTGLGHLLLKMSELKGPYTLLVDRTNWQFGKVDINFLVFSILGDGYSIPIKWVLLPKKGNSAQYERIELLEEVVKIVGKGQIKNVIGDREFIGQHWVKYLITNEIEIVDFAVFLIQQFFKMFRRFCFLEKIKCAVKTKIVTGHSGGFILCIST